MSEYVIITDTSADIPASILDKGQIHLIPMIYQLNGEEHPHKDPGHWDSKAFYDRLRDGGTGSTSQIPPATYTSSIMDTSKSRERSIVQIAEKIAPFARMKLSISTSLISTSL